MWFAFKLVSDTVVVTLCTLSWTTFWISDCTTHVFTKTGVWAVCWLTHTSYFIKVEVGHGGWGCGWLVFFPPQAADLIFYVAAFEQPQQIDKMSVWEISSRKHPNSQFFAWSCSFTETINAYIFFATDCNINLTEFMIYSWYFCVWVMFCKTRIKDTAKQSWSESTDCQLDSCCSRCSHSCFNIRWSECVSVHSTTGQVPSKWQQLDCEQSACDIVFACEG